MSVRRSTSRQPAPADDMSQVSPHRAGIAARRERKQKMNAGAAAIMGSITRKGRGGAPSLFMPIAQVAASLEQAIAIDPDAISFSLVVQATESERGAVRLLEAFAEVADQAEAMELGDYEVREDPMTKEEMDDAISHQLALALAGSFDTTEGSESPLVIGGLTEAISACRVPMPDALAPTHQVITYLKDLVEYLDNDPLEEGWMGLVVDEVAKVCFRLQREQIDLGGLASAAAKTWAHTPSSIELTSLLLRPRTRPTDEGGASETESVQPGDGDETEEDEGDQALHEKLEERHAALEARLEKKIVSFKNAFSKRLEQETKTFSKRLEQETTKTSSLEEEVKELKTLVHRLQVEASGSPSPPRVPIILRKLPAAKLEEYSDQIREKDPRALFGLYDELGKDMCEALLLHVKDQEDRDDRGSPSGGGLPTPQPRGPPPGPRPLGARRTSVTAYERDRERSTSVTGGGFHDGRGPRPRGSPLAPRSTVGLHTSAEGEKSPVESFIRFTRGRGSRTSRLGMTTPAALICMVTGLDFDPKTGKLLDGNGQLVQRASITNGGVEIALLAAAPTIAGHLNSQDLGLITESRTTTGHKTIELVEEENSLYLKTIRGVRDDPNQVWMVQVHTEEGLGGTEQALIMLLGASSTEGQRALEFVKECQDHWLVTLGLLKECYTKCLQEEGTDKGEELFKMILTLIIDTVTLQTTPVIGALTKALATQHLIACLLGYEYADTYFVNHDHDAMAIKGLGNHQTQAAKFNVLLARINADLPYDSDTGESPGDGGAGGGASRSAWTVKEKADWKREAEAAAHLDSKTVAAHEKSLTYLNALSGTSKSSGPAASGSGPGVACPFCPQSSHTPGGHKAADCANLAAFATHRKLATGKALQAAHLEMAKLNKALVATLIRDKFFVKKLAMVLPGGAHFHP